MNVFFEDVVLDRAGEPGVRHVLLFAGDDVERHDRQHRAVHGHRHAHLIQRYAVEQRAHVEDGIDRHARHADVADDARMVGIIAAVRGQIESDREALLPVREVAPVEGVGILGRGKTRVLADGPRLLHVHGRVGPAPERGHAGKAVDEVEPGAVGRRVRALHRDPFRREPRFAGWRRGFGNVGVERERGEIGEGHLAFTVCGSFARSSSGRHTLSILAW
jgi:hypothetical protein